MQSHCCGVHRPLRGIAVTWALALLVSGCAARTAPTAMTRVHVERLYFGRDIGDTAVVSDSAWDGFIRDVLIPAFPQGATIFDANGYWQDPKGVVTREKSFVVELMHVSTTDTEARVVRVMAAYKQLFAQQAVLRVITNASSEFY